MAKARALEKPIENAILEWLSIMGIFAWKNNSIGVYDPARKIYRKSRNKFHLNGVSDILGILPGGAFLAIEVKSPQNKVRPPEQVAFINAINRNGGVAFFATSVDEVQKELTKHGYWPI